MPRIVNYKPGAIIFFANDKADAVYLLKQGKVSLTYTDIQSGEQIVEGINTGEFFGVKSGLVGYEREETAKVVQPSAVIEFSSQEFEILITKNTNIILKMLRAFSNQLRRVGKQVQSLVTTKTSNDPATELFQIGDYYLTNKKYSQALTVYKRYIKYYPKGSLVARANERCNTAEEALTSYGDGGGPTPMLDEGTTSQ